MNTTTETITLDTLKDEFFRRMNGKAKNTLDEYRRSITRLYDFMNNNKIETIEARKIGVASPRFTLDI